MNDAERTRVRWRTSSYSNGGGACVEVAPLDSGHVAVRDTKAHGTGPILTFQPDAWSAFVTATKDGDFDLS